MAAQIIFLSICGSKGCAEINIGNVNFVTFPEAIRHIKRDVLGPNGETHLKETFFIIQLHMPGGNFSLPPEFRTETDARNHWDKMKTTAGMETIDA